MQSHKNQRSAAARMMVLLVTTILCANPARAEKVLYSFSGTMGGWNSQAPLVLDNAGNLYGTTTSGPNNACCGAVFELTHTDTGWVETVIYSFQGGSDGKYPNGLAIDKQGNLYGTAQGGDFNCGVFFRATPRSGGGWGELTLYSFGQVSTDACEPLGSLTMDSSGNLYGLTQVGGSQNLGTVFELTPSGGAWIENVLWSFNGPDGANPSAFVFDSSGNIYGTTTSAGVYNEGGVFKLIPTSGGWTETSIFSFTGGDNGCSPNNVVFDSSGNLYGTTQACGADNVGTFFRLTPTVGQWKMSVLHAFTGGFDGAIPNAGIMFDKAGNLWGTASLGGLYGDGTVFRLIPPFSGGRWTLGVYSFKGSSDGANPHAGVVFGKSTSGTLAYGTTLAGGLSNIGVVYQIYVK